MGIPMAGITGSGPQIRIRGGIIKDYSKIVKFSNSYFISARA
jgi:hypothetical protein